MEKMLQWTDKRLGALDRVSGSGGGGGVLDRGRQFIIGDRVIIGSVVWQTADRAFL